jgi:hypothetical protein
MTYVQQQPDLIEVALRPRERPTRNAAELYRLYALLGLVKSEQVTLENVHDARSVWMSDIDSEQPALQQGRHRRCGQEPADQRHATLTAATPTECFPRSVGQ